EDLMITCKSGITIRMKVAAISEQGRATQGVKLIRIEEGDEIAALTKLDEAEEEEVLAEMDGETNQPEENNNTETTNLPESTSEGEQETPLA
ncbi:MAG TPA: DNA gyrase C-terminal beta-propeller domain-containing protein, partial [Flavisolibacter sp.]|nr:DNA gyrase C-terminal beta-propeller domain-containing protein [Flavisolibacter sp.]